MWWWHTCRFESTRVTHARVVGNFPSQGQSEYIDQVCPKIWTDVSTVSDSASLPVRSVLNLNVNAQNPPRSLPVSCQPVAVASDSTLRKPLGNKLLDWLAQVQQGELLQRHCYACKVAIAKNNPHLIICIEGSSPPGFPKSLEHSSLHDRDFRVSDTWWYSTILIAIGECSASFRWYLITLLVSVCLFVSAS